MEPRISPSQVGFGPERLERLERMVHRRHFWLQGRSALVLSLLGRAQARSMRVVLDLGGGNGTAAAELERRGFRVTTVDLLADGLARARRLDPEASLLQADARALPLADGAADLLLALDLLEHVPETPLLTELARVLRPGGRVLLTVPAFPGLWSHRDEAAGHLRRYSRKSLRQALSRAGFEVETLRFYQWALFPAVAASRLLARRRPRVTEMEEAPAPWLNRLLAAVNLFEVRLGAWIPWPWGSSLAVLCRRGAP